MASQESRYRWTFDGHQSHTMTEAQMPTEGQGGHYACDFCVRHRRRCVIAIKGVLSVTPLAPSLRMGCGLSKREY
jgi:hypothetical protein